MKKRKLILFILFLLVFMSVFWMMGFENTFCFDDFTNILRVTDASYSELFHFLPHATYNDRPMGDLLIKVLYTLFGLNPQGYHVAFVAIHFFNVILIYKIVKMLLEDSYQERAYLGAVIAAGVFGIYPVSLMAPSWIVAEFDIICMPFYLCSMYCFLQYISRDKRKAGNYWYGIAALVCYYFGLRSKEMAITLPVLFILYELYKKVKKDKTHKISWVSLAGAGIMLFYFYIILTGEKLPDMNSEHPYYQSFNPISMLIVAIKYLFFYFDWKSGDFSFIGFSKSSIVGVTIFTIIVIYALYKCIIKKQFEMILAILCIGISLAPVLPMVNTQHRLYFYIPSMYIGLLFALVILDILKSREGILYGVSVSFLILVYMCNILPGPQLYKNAWLNYCRKDSIGIEDIKNIEPPEKGSTVYIRGAKEGYNVFYYGPGNSLRLFWKDKELKVELVDTLPEIMDEEYMVLDYTPEGRVIEADRSGR